MEYCTSQPPIGQGSADSDALGTVNQPGLHSEASHLVESLFLPPLKHTDSTHAFPGDSQRIIKNPTH